MNIKRLIVLVLASILILALASVCMAAISSRTVNHAWVPHHGYKTGDFVIYGGRIYQCLQGHTSMVGWEPPNVPAIWRLIPLWAPNTGYNTGDLVDYQLKVYQCLQAHTSMVGWEPPNVPMLWKLIFY